MRPDSLPRLWRYINLLLTYLLIQVSAALRSQFTGLDALFTQGHTATVQRRFTKKACLQPLPYSE